MQYGEALACSLILKRMLLLMKDSDPDFVREVTEYSPAKR